MPTPDKIDQLYDALKADGAVSKSRENFRSYMLASGKQGYVNRKQLYDALKADEAVESATYDEFRDRLGLHAVKPQQPVARPSSTPQSVQQQPQKPQPKPQKAKQQPKKTAWKPTPAQQHQFQQTINSAKQTIQNVNERHKNMIEYSKQRIKHPFGQPQVQIGFKRKNTPTVFDNRNLVQGRDEFNPKTGKLEPTYLTASGNKYNSKVMADAEQRQIDDAMERELHPIETQLRDAYAERDRLNKLAQKRVDELEKSHEELPWYLQLGEYANSDKMPDAGSPVHRWDNDMQYKQYMAALRKNRALITTLEDKRSGKMNEFWHTLGNEITNGYTFSLAGKAQMDDVAALTFAQKHVDSINRKRQKGEALTKEEQAAEAVLKNAEWDNRVQSQYGDEYGAWARAGKMGAVSLDLMMDFALMGGQPLSLAKSIAGGTGKLATKLIGNAATRGFGKYMVKATGATLGSMVAGAEIANTVGVGRTMSDAAGRYQGDIILDENGDYVFGHFEDDGKGGQKLVKGGDSFIGAVLAAERTAIAENGSEIAGAFLPGGKVLLKGLEKIGLSKIASGLTSLSGKQWYAAYSRALQTAGFNGVPGEALEEYVGTGFDALMGGEEWKNLADKRTHVDIWLGCATMGALLNAPRIVGTGYQMAQYYRYKHNTDKSDRLAEIQLGNEVWEPLRQQIDEATNGQITDVLVNVLDNENLDGEQKKAVAEYAANLQRMRGYSLGRVSSEQRDDEHQPTQRELDEQTLEQSYTQGYGATDIADMQDIKHGMDYQHERVASFADANLMSVLDGSPMDAIDAIRSNEQLSDEQKQIAIDYVNARNTHNALLQRINDDADVLAEEDRELYKQMQHKTDGSLRPAVLKEKDSEGNDQQVYIVDGNVQMMPDGSMVDKAASDNIVVVCNPATGESKQIDPSADTGISSLGEVITAEQREADIERMRQEYVQSQIDEAHGTVRLAPGQQIVLPTGEEAVVMSLTPVPSPNGEGRSEDTDVVVALGDGTQTTVRLSELQRIRDEKAAADYRQRHGNLTPDLSPKDEGSEQPQTDGRVAGAPADYTADMELTIRDEDGTEKPATVMGRVRYENGSFIPDANGNIVEYESNGETLHDHITALGDKVVSHTEERNVPTEMPQYSLDDDVYLQTDDGEIHGTIIAEENPDGLITIQSEQPIGGRIVNQFTREQLDSMTGNNAGAVQSEPSTVQNDVENVPETTENVPNNDENVQTAEETVAVEPMPMVGEGEDAEPDFGATTPQRAHDYIFNESGLDEADATEFTKNNVDAANKELEKIKNRKPKMGTSIAKFNKDKAVWERKVNEAQAKADYWKQVKAARDKVLAQRLAEQQKRERQQIEQAQADEAAYREEMARKEAEQAALGTNNVSPAIRDKWVNAPKVEGAQDEIVLPNGEKVAGRYYLVESGAASASHDSNNGFVKTDGFPVDENGGSVNDRDYERDMDAQRITRDIANNYDSRAVQTPVVVSQDGVVLSGNGRTMAGELAAAQGTDAAYNSHIAQYPTKWGFTKQQVEGMQHPRVVFVPDASMPYTAETFAKFNQQEMKGQSKTEQAVKLGKVVSDKAFNRIIRIINRFDTLGDFYADSKATSEAIAELQGDGVLSQAQLAEMVDGGGISAIGKELLENTLIGKAFESNPNAVRDITEYKSMRQSIITALAEISNNLSLDKEYSLESELAQAIDLVYQARKSGSKLGEPVSWFARQQNLDFFGLSDTVADYNNATMLMIADIINDNRSSLLKKYIQIYNHNAKDSANGQLDLFTGSVKGKGDIINEVKQLFSNGSEEEQQKAAQEAVARRKAESIQENGTVANGSEGSDEDNDRVEETPAEQTPTEEDGSKPVMSHDEKMAFMRQFLEDTAGDMRLLDVVTDEEVQKLIDLYDAWEVVNDGLGAAHDANDALLNDKNKAIAQKAKENIETAEHAANAAFAPVEDYYNELCDKYGITDEEEPAANATGTVAAAITEAEAATEVNPTDAQKEAGNYKKGHVKVDGFDITIENPKGSVRRGTDASGKQWEQEMQNTYGYIRGTEGVDGDHIDVFFSEDPSQGDVFVVDQVNKDGSFDEHKVMYGFPDIESARKAYLSNYEDGWQGLGAITPVSKEEFKKWIDSSHRKTKPFAEYKNVKVEGNQRASLRQQKVFSVDDVSPRESAMRDALVDLLRGAGVEVVTDVEEGQRVLDEANDGARMQAKINALDKAARTIQNWISNGVRGKVFTIELPESVRRMIRRAMGRDYDSHNITSNGIVHSMKNHGVDGRKLTPNSIPLRQEDFSLIPYIMTAPDRVEKASMDASGRESVRFYKNLSNGYVVVVEKEYKNSPDDMETISMWAEMSDKATNARHDAAPDTHVQNAILDIDAAKIRKDAETAIVNDEKLRQQKVSGVRFFRTADGHAYGFTAGGKIYIDPRIATAETPIHEYSHLWSYAMRELNHEEWANIVELMKGTTLWDDVKQRYPELKTEDEIADEVLAQYSGRSGAERLRAEQDKIAKGDGDVFEKSEAISVLNRVKDALKRFWKGVADWFGIHFTSAEEVADKVLSDLLNGVNPVSAMKSKDGGVRYEANSEEAGIVAKAKAEGTYMKAPNGKPSRLTPRQWVQVRTKAFKEWFGDWEKAAKVLNVVPAFKEHGFKNFDDARSWAKEHIVRTLTDEETGGKGEIRISNNAVAKFLSESAVAKSDSKDVHLSVLKVLPDVIRESVDAEQHPDYKKGEDGSRSVENGVNEHVTIHRLYGAVNVDGKTYMVKVTMKEDRTNNEPQKAYSYEATKIELLAGQHEEAVTSSRNSNNSITAANLLQNVEKSYGNGEKLLDCSKIVDENGEPRVVYHQTNSTIFVNKETGENFDDLNWKEKDYWQNEASEEEWNDTWEEQDFYVFDNKTHGRRSVEMPAFFFSPVYDEYHEYGERTVTAFLNIRNPIVNPDIPNRGVTDTAGEDAMNALIAQGYDGFIREYDGEVEEINAFFPNQIKSAEENVGTFDGENPDIRYQFVGEKGAAAMDKAEEASVRLDNLAVAREMEAAGKDAKTVKLATGWERGGDGKWRYEIEDFDSSGLENLVREDNKKKLRLSEHRRTLLGRKWEMESEVYPDRYFDEFSDAEREQWDREHTAEIAELNDLSKEIDRLKKQEESSGIYTDLGTVVGKDHVLFKYYPELEGAVVHITDMPSSVGGNYKPGVITLNRGALYDSSILNHEVQHAIQEIEGFARGGSVRDVRKRIMKRISELDGVSEHAKEMLARQVEYQALASKLGYVYERLMKNGEDWAVRAASGFYWDAMNTLDNDENSKLENAYPKGMNASEIAKEGFNRDKAIEELKRLSDYYASQISAEDMKNIKESETLSGKIDGKSEEELYHALGGEVEARNVQSRLGMTAEERRASLASETEDVARDDQIFLEDGLGESMSESTAAATTESTDTVRYRIPEDEPPTKTHNAEKNRHGLDVLSQKSTRVYSAKERREREAYAERQWLRAHEVANEIIDKLNISDDITVYESIDEVPGSEDFSAKRRRAKGWYDPRTNKIVVVLGNHRSPNDVLQTILHEAVAHYGLRKLFGKNFETFLDNVYKHADMDVHRRIISMASNKGWDIREATEEYLASLAEDTDFDNAESRSWAGHWFNKIKQLFLDMLHHIGLRDYDGVSLTDNELRYILWRSYKNLAEPGHYRNYFSIAEDTVMQSNLHVGYFTEETGQTIEQSTKVAESGLMFRDGDFSLRDRAIARDTYERMVSTGGYQFQEAVQDSMLGLKRLYQSILGKGTRMEDVDGFENAYSAENRMSSVNAAEQHEYYVRYMKPLLKAISDIVGSNNGKRLELTDYMMAKHGLERNVVMAQRDFDAYKQQYPNGTKTLDDFRERDYAGLTALTGEDDVAMAELAAQQMVDTYEQDHDTSELWQRVNDATSATLAKIYSSGLLSKERYEQIQKMFEYYIPLQGWDETTSDEVYGYLTSKNGPLGGSPIKHAKGRSSKADDPIATIALMADDAIRQGNRNKMKQTFLNFVLNHQSDLVSVNDLWLQYNAVMDEWEPVFADIENTDTAADVERKVEAFEERMQQLAESDPDNYKRGRDAQNIPYKVVKDNLKEHQVLVRRNGRTYVLTINGNPRAAQALNGLTNPDVETGGVVGNLMQGAQWLNRNLSAFYTTRNPDFVASNFLRDMLYSNCMTWVKESPKYALRFHKNFGRVNPAHMRILLGKWENGTLDESNYIENLFKQFMLNGGETGYTNIKDIDGHKREIASELKRNGSNARKAWQWLGEQLDLLNGSAENCARFAAFVTSREEGRSIERSIYDAKEISVNFNKKGSGGKMVNSTGQTLLGKVGSYVGGGGRLLYVFWNAGIQGTTNFARAAKRNPKKATAGAASMFMLGAVIPLLAQAMGGGDDDDKNAYYNLPEYVRRSNIIINAGNQWIAVPLPIEFRAFYGLGELATGVITGNERYSDSELAFQMGSQISQILPLDMLEGGGGINPFVPSIAKPFVEAYIMNKSWTGLPVYKDSPWNKNNPEWTKAYKSANTYLISGAKWLNEISGGDDYKKGYIDINPAKVEYLLSGMFGGAFTTGDKLVKMGETIFSDREFDWRNMLIANRVVKTGDERTANRKLSNEYFKYKDEYEETKRLLKKYSDEAATNERYKHRLERLQQSEEYLLYDVFDNYQPILKNLHDAKDGADEATLKSIENEENALRRDMVDLMHAIEDDEKPDINAHVDAMLKREFEAGGRTQKPAGSRIAKRLGGTDSYGSPQNEYGQVYLQMRDYVDLAEDVMLQAALKKAKDSGDTDRAKDIESARRQITEVKKDLTEVPYTLSDGTEVTAKDIMQELRDLRKNLLNELGITTQQQPNR